MAASLVLHGLVVALAIPRLAEARRDENAALAPDIWAGNTVDIEATGGAFSPAAPPGPPPPPDPPQAAAAPVEQPAVDVPAPRAVPQEPTNDAEREPEPKRAPEPPREKPRPERASPAQPSREEPVPEWQRMFASRAEQMAAPSSGSFGSAATAGPARNLAKAFTRAITQATNADRIWANLPPGDAGSVTVRIVVDEQQSVVTAEPLDRVVAPHLKRLIERTLRFLQVGRFSISAAGVGAGTETLKLELSIAEETAETDFQLGFEAPRIGRPGKAYFRNWGRRFEARVTIVSSEAKR